MYHTGKLIGAAQARQEAGVNLGQDTIAQRGEVSNQLMMLREMIGQLESQTDELSDKLTPISRGATPLSGVEEKQPQIQTEVGMALHDLCCRVMYLSTRVCDMRNRVEI